MALLFVSSLVADTSSVSSNGFPVLESYSSAEVGSELPSWFALQSPQGEMLFGGRGLVSFDGERWRTSPMNHGYALRGLDFAPDGRLWAGAIGELGWFERRSTGEWIYHSLLARLPDEHANIGQVLYAFSEGQGAIFVTENKVLRWDGAHFHVWAMNEHRRLWAGRFGGEIFVQVPMVGLHVMTKHGPQLSIPADVLGTRGVFWIGQRGAMSRLITSAGIFDYDGERLQAVSLETNAILRKAVLTTAIDLRDGRFALGSKAGVFVIDPAGNVLRTFTDADGLPTSFVFSLCFDRDRQLWATSTSHLFRLNLDSPSALFDSRASLPSNPISKILVTETGVFGATDQKTYVLKPQQRQFEPHVHLDEHVWDLRRSPSGAVLAATLGHVKLVHGNSVEQVYTNRRENYLIEPSRRDPNHWLVSESGMIARLGVNWQQSVAAKDLPDAPSSIAEDQEGNLWVGTAGHGLLRVDAKGNFSRSVSMPEIGLHRLDGRVSTLGTTEGDIAVFSTAGAWIRTRASSTFMPIRNFPLRETFAMSSTRDRASVWLVLARTANRPAAVGAVRITDEGATWQPHAVDEISRIGSPRSIFAERTEDNRTILWIGGTGILRHEVNNGPSAPRPRAPILRVLARAGGERPPQAVTAPLPYSIAAIEFEFAAPQFATRATLRLETRIDGIDGDWLPGGPSSRRELTAVRDGRYRFRVRAVADTGAISDETTFSFQVRPPWWRSTLAILGYLFAVVPLGYAGYRLRLRALRLRNVALEQKVRERTEELEAANAAKTQFVANMSHDIRNPLNGIVGLSLALEDTRLDSRQREIVATLRECTTYLSSLVDDVLDFASIEAGRVELRPGAFAPQKLLRSIVETLKADATASGATLSIEVAPDVPPSLLGDAGRIQQILVNFVSNALKYAGGKIQLSVSVPANSSGEVEFAVTDRGPGISAVDQATLFTKFTRVKQQRGDEVIPGTGLGLAACRLLADIMGGSVGVESREGAGARFFLRLPLTIALAPVAPAAAHLPNTTVLLVEDTDYNAWAASAVLAKLGLSCERARTGAEALQIFGEKRFNVVLLDRNLPDMDGTEVARRMRELEPDGTQAVLLAVTAYCTAEDRELCLKSGMDAFVGKPLTPEKLRKVLLEAGGRQLAAASVQVPAEPVTTEPDLTLLTYLSDGSAQGLGEQIDRFVATLDQFDQKLCAALAANALSDLQVHAHRLVGHAKMVGEGSLVQVAAQLEAIARSGDATASAEWLPRVREQIRLLTEAVRHRHSDAQPA